MADTVKDICNIFFELEEKYKINFLEIQGVYPWQLIRIFLYYHITGKKKLFGSAQQQRLTLFDKVKSFIPFIKNSLIYNPFKGNDEKDFIIFDHPRKTLFQNEYKDIYSYFLVDLLKGKYSFEVMESPYLNKHYTKNEDYIRYTDRIELGSYKYKKTTKLNYSEKEIAIIDEIEKELEKKFDLSLDLFTIINNHILNFKYDYKKYTELFEKRKPKKIFVVVAYENKAIVSAAKDLGIEVIELQHGTISNYHLGYSYPKKTRCLNGEIKEIAYYPDKILTFGEYWINDEVSPIASDNIIPIGFPYFEAQSKEFINKNIKKNKIIFISQGVIGKYMSEIAYEAAINLKDWEIIYKLHPGEYMTWRENYKILNEASNLDNFQVIDNNQTPLYQFFAESKIQVGAFSTAIYEGLMFNCKTFILDLPGVEYLEDLIEEGYVCKVENGSELVNKLNAFKPKTYDKNFFFKNLDKDLLNRLVQK